MIEIILNWLGSNWPNLSAVVLCALIAIMSTKHVKNELNGFRRSMENKMIDDIKSIKDTTEKIMNNHLSHVQSSLDGVNISFSGVSEYLQDLNTALKDKGSISESWASRLNQKAEDIDQKNK
jgi:archaellum component FlaC